MTSTHFGPIRQSIYYAACWVPIHVYDEHSVECIDMLSCFRSPLRCTCAHVPTRANFEGVMTQRSVSVREIIVSKQMDKVCLGE